MKLVVAALFTTTSSRELRLDVADHLLYRIIIRNIALASNTSAPIFLHLRLFRWLPPHSVNNSPRHRIHGLRTATRMFA